TSGTLGDIDHAIHAQVFNESGAKIGGEFLVNSQTSSYQSLASVAALGDSGFVITWTGESGTSEVKAQIFSLGLSQEATVAVASSPFIETAVSRASDVLQPSGSDILIGNLGDNVLTGGLGDDHLTGSGGNDTYVVGRNGGHDVIANGLPSNAGPSGILRL